MTQRKYPEAETLFQEVLKGRTAKLGADHLDTITTRHDLAVLYWLTKRLDRSIPLFEEVVKQRKKKLGTLDPKTVIALANLGVNYRDAGQLSSGIRCLEEALAAIHASPGPIPPPLRWVPGELARTYNQARQFAKAEPLYRAFLQQATQQVGADDPRTAGLMAQLALNLLAQNKHAEAETMLRDCLAVRDKKQPDEWTTFNTRSMLGAALLGQKKYAEAEPLLNEGYEGMKQRQDKIPEPSRKLRLTEALERLVQLYEAMDNQKEAARWRKELKASQQNSSKQ
jgi:tetratricopeptide (TPR) repeat protein